MTSPDAAKLDLEIATRLAGAEVVVRGRLRVGATRDGHIGTIAVDAILRGAIATDVSFISVPARATEETAIYFLTPEGERYRVIEQADALGLPVSLEPSVIAEAGYHSKLVWARELDAVKPELDAFRKSRSAEAARTIFAKVSWIGIPSSEIERMLGPPDAKLPDGRWRYAMFVIGFGNDRANVVEIHRKPIW